MTVNFDLSISKIKSLKLRNKKSFENLCGEKLVAEKRLQMCDGDGMMNDSLRISKFL
jgi:hypothetical protein